MTNYIEEAVEFLAGEFNASDHGEEVIRTTLQEVDRRAREETIEEIRKGVKKLDGTSLPDTYSESDDIIDKEQVYELLSTLNK